MKILGADERLAQKSGAKILITGPSGVGKTSLLRTLDQAMLSSTLFVDIEAGDIAIADLPVASVRPRRWEDCRDVACILGGANPALPPTACYSEAHCKHVAENAELARLASFQVLFVDSPPPHRSVSPGPSTSPRRSLIADERTCARSTGFTLGR